MIDVDISTDTADVSHALPFPVPRHPVPVHGTASMPQ
jgi:hypothetical protein